MSVLPTLKPEELVRILEKFGYQRYRQKGSHLIMIKKGSYYHPVVPLHNSDIKKGTLRAIIRQTGMTVEQFLSYE